MPLATQAPIPEPLTTKFFANMLNLEILIQTHNHDFRTVDELIQHYAVLSFWGLIANCYA